MDQSFPPGKLPGDPRFTDVYVNTSRGQGDTTGPWCEGKGFSEIITPDESFLPVDGGDGQARVTLVDAEKAAVDAFAVRGASDPSRDPVTGADLGTLAQESEPAECGIACGHGLVKAPSRTATPVLRADYAKCENIVMTLDEMSRQPNFDNEDVFFHFTECAHCR
jgi:hypothetical protein